MPSEKSPFRGFTVQEVLAVEATSYVIQVGADFFSNNGHFAFSKRSAAIFHGKILRDLQYVMKNGSKKEKVAAEECLKTLRIVPLRIN